MQQLHLIFPVSPGLFRPEAIWVMISRAQVSDVSGLEPFSPASPTRGGDPAYVHAEFPARRGAGPLWWPWPRAPAVQPWGLAPCAWESLPIQEQPGTADPGRLRAFKEVWGSRQSVFCAVETPGQQGKLEI